MRRRRPAVRRREGRRHRRPARAQQARAGAPDAPLRRRDRHPHRPGRGRPGAGHGHRRADHGVDHGHLQHDARPLGAGRRHRQAGDDRRQQRPRRGDGPRRALRHAGGVPATAASRSQGARVAVQGFGNVGSVAAKLLDEAGAKIVAVSDSNGGALQRRRARDIDAILRDCKHEHGFIPDGARGARASRTRSCWSCRSTS